MGEYDALNAPLHAIAETLDDIEQVRIATQNRLRSLMADDALPAQLAGTVAVLDQIEAAEKALVKELQRAMRAHPLGPWVRHPDRKGVGEKQAARLLAAIGNPYWNHTAGRARRGPAELWAYCGFHVLPTSSHRSIDTQRVSAAGGDTSCHPTDQGTIDAQSATVGGVAARRRKGQKANWNDTARMRARLIAESCLKSGGPYRAVYDHGRALNADRELTPLHQHNRALRLVAKTVLRDMWIASRDWHEGQPSAHPTTRQTASETQRRCAGGGVGHTIPNNPTTGDTEQ